MRGTNFEFPGMSSFERVPVGRGESQNAGLGSPIIGFGNGVEFLLTCGVPQHQSHIFSVHSEIHKRPT